MKKLIQNSVVALLALITTTIGTNSAALAQCSVSGIPTYSSGCTNEYFTSISASGLTVISTISLTGGTCGGVTYFNKYATQGITVTAGNAVNLNITRYTTTYTGHLSVYVDWNNDGIYTPATELAGTMLTLPSSLLTTVYSFPVPTTGLIAGIHLHMRVMLSEVATGAPCTANYGQTYDYYLQANCASTTTVTVSPPSGTICNGGSGISFTGSGAGPGGSYTWMPSAGLSATTGATVIATPTVTTIYSVTGTSSIGCSGTNTASVTVNPSPSAVVTSSGPLTICSGDSAILTTPLVTGNTYQWFLGTTAITGATNNSYTATAAGSYTLKVTNSFGCSTTSAIFVVVVHPSVPVSITHSGAIAFCAGDSVKLTATSGTGYAYQWLLNSVTITGATNATFTALINGNYSCNISIPSVCTISTATIAITVHPLPVPLITFDGKTFRTGNFYSSYQWFENGTAIAGATHDSVIAHSNGSYSVTVTDTNGCKATSVVYPLTHLAVQNINGSDLVNIYPNPATSLINIESPVILNAVISGTDGKMLLQQNKAQTVDIHTLPSGLYIIELFDQSGHRILIRKLLKN